MVIHNGSHGMLLRSTLSLIKQLIIDSWIGQLWQNDYWRNKGNDRPLFMVEVRFEYSISKITRYWNDFTVTLFPAIGISSYPKHLYNWIHSYSCTNTAVYAMTFTMFEWSFDKFNCTSLTGKMWCHISYKALIISITHTHHAHVHKNMH